MRRVGRSGDGISSAEIGLLDGSPLRASSDDRQCSIERYSQVRVPGQRKGHVAWGQQPVRRLNRTRKACVHQILQGTYAIDDGISSAGCKCVEGIRQVAKLLICEVLGIQVFRS